MPCSSLKRTVFIPEHPVETPGTTSTEIAEIIDITAGRFATPPG
jgi:hypothetical protein